MPSWSVIVPVKPASVGKSRLGGSPALARAIALDTIAAALATPAVAEVLVVTRDAETADAAIALGARVMPEPVTTVDPLNAAVLVGVTAAGMQRVAVLLGDVPALRPDDLDVTLAAASEVALGVVPDADGTGTVLLTATAGSLRPAFGAGSLRRHLDAGHVVVDAPASLRRDVDTPEHLRELADLELLGPRTSAVHGRTEPTRNLPDVPRPTSST